MSRRTAVHCDALLKAHAPPVDLSSQLVGVARKLARALRPVLAEWSGSPAIEVRPLGVETVDGAALAKRFRHIAANSLHAFGGAGDTLLLSLDARALVEQLDRAFGGDGQIGSEPLKALPPSVDLLAEQLEAKITAALSETLDRLELRLLARDVRYGDIAPFADRDEIALLAIEVAENGRKPWSIALAARLRSLPALLTGRGTSPSAPRERGQTGPGAAPFAEMPLCATATLVDMTIPLAKLAGLAPGVVIPIAVARNVPLRVGEITVARGTIGELDDRVALQITQTQASEKEFS